MLAEMVALVQAGVPPEAIDSAMKSFGMPVGPCTLADEVGLDTSYHVLETMIKALGDRMLGPNNEGIKAAVAAGYTGRKGGRGFYVYPTQTGKGGKESKGPRPINTDMITLQTTKYAPTVPGYDAATVERLKKDPKLLVDRLILRFIKECIHGLQVSAFLPPLHRPVAHALSCSCLLLAGLGHSICWRWRHWCSIWPGIPSLPRRALQIRGSKRASRGAQDNARAGRDSRATVCTTSALEGQSSCRARLS